VKLPDLSRFELQCLKKIWDRGEATVRDIHGDFPDPPTYSTVKKIVERLEEKGAIERVRKVGNAWVYRSAVPASAMIRKEISRLLDAVFDGAAQPLVAHLADMRQVSVEDLKEIERHLRHEHAEGAQAKGPGGDPAERRGRDQAEAEHRGDRKRPSEEVEP
jgi:predicted transcriptional regulator